MSKHIGYPGERMVLTVTVQSAVERETQYGPVCDHTLVTPEGNVLWWTTDSRSAWLTEGQTYTVKATIKMHNVEGGVHRTVVLRVVEFHETPRTPRVAIGLRRMGGKR